MIEPRSSRLVMTWNKRQTTKFDHEQARSQYYAIEVRRQLFLSMCSNQLQQDREREIMADGNRVLSAGTSLSCSKA
jgi:hypothetical protein